mgnify:CR=1 FL=1
MHYDEFFFTNVFNKDIVVAKSCLRLCFTLINWRMFIILLIYAVVHNFLSKVPPFYHDPKVIVILIDDRD